MSHAATPDPLTEARAVLRRVGKPNIWTTCIGDVPAIIYALQRLVDHTTRLTADLADLKGQQQ